MLNLSIIVNKNRVILHCYHFIYEYGVGFIYKNCKISPKLNAFLYTFSSKLFNGYIYTDGYHLHVTNEYSVGHFVHTGQLRLQAAFNDDILHMEIPLLEGKRIFELYAYEHEQIMKQYKSISYFNGKHILFKNNLLDLGDSDWSIDKFIINKDILDSIEIVRQDIENNIVNNNGRVYPTMADIVNKLIETDGDYSQTKEEITLTACGSGYTGLPKDIPYSYSYEKVKDVTEKLDVLSVDGIFHKTHNITTNRPYTLLKTLFHKIKEYKDDGIHKVVVSVGFGGNNYEKVDNISYKFDGNELVTVNVSGENIYFKNADDLKSAIKIEVKL